ncbi:ketopantoate reductase family protein [Natronomonas salsuginis]|jgi:2-dehydropantoate 2-reductase|uniref:2-dehydropantoate 2-reductase n=1 Tax=Natronomonas salsuginis TaxID=2217661 RepID=A0A4U5J7N7_9EURY|nr:2-dehydropantoate 2-reductase [Natronomonas salsuginis]TKR24425.1 2-dehydropantoate 2-reductase [Natronomonas salsuginis]
MTQVAILGAGALGGVFGGYLSRGGVDVTLVDIWEEHVSQINEEGLLVERQDRDDVVIDVPATTDSGEIGVVDVLFVFVKSYHTRTALESSEELFDENTTVVTLQNGLLNMDYISQYVPKSNIVGGATTIGSSTEGPRHVLHTGWGDTKIAGDDENRVTQVAQLLEKAGVEVHTADDPEAVIWAKQFVSVGIKPVAALTGLLDGPLSDHGESAAVMDRLVEEAMQVAKARGIPIEGDPVAETHHNCQINYDTMSSMLEDVQNGRQTEIDQINGAIVKYATEEDIDVPYNRMATNLIKAKEHSYTE